MEKESVRNINDGPRIEIKSVLPKAPSIPGMRPRLGSQQGGPSINVTAENAEAVFNNSGSEILGHAKELDIGIIKRSEPPLQPVIRSVGSLVLKTAGEALQFILKLTGGSTTSHLGHGHVNFIVSVPTKNVVNLSNKDAA